MKEKDKLLIEEKKPLTDYQMNCNLANEVHKEVLIDWVSNMSYSDELKKEAIQMIRVVFDS